MLAKTPAIVLHHFPYGERSVIIRMYTREFGLQSYLIPSARSKNSPITPALMHPLQGLDLVAYQHHDDRLERIKEAHRTNRIEQIHQNPIKSAIAQYMAEVILRSSPDQEPIPELFDFVLSCIASLDGSSNEIANLPIYFTLKLTEYYGFYPFALAGGCVFDLREGSIGPDIPHHPDFAQNEDCSALIKMINEDWTTVKNMSLGADLRIKNLKTLEKYYRIHIKESLAFKSLDVLHMVLS